MEQTVINATHDYLQSQINQKDERIQQLEEHVQRVTQRDFRTAAELNAMREDLKTFTLHELENNDITNEQAEKLAVIGNFELTNEIDVQVMVEYSFTVNVPAGQDVEDIINDIAFDNIDYDTDKVSLYNVAIDRIDS